MTSQEIAQRDDNPAGELEPAHQYQSALLTWLEEARLTHQIAQSLAKTSFVPASLQGKPHDITAAILAGAELGLQPMATLRSIDVIFGTPALRAHAMRGLVQSRGHQVELVESTDTACRMRGRRCIGRIDFGTIGVKTNYEEWQEVTWTIERARRMGLADKDQWKKQPQTMLVARATAEICRLIASDVLYAMPYAAEELDRDKPPAVEQRRVTKAEILGEQEAEPEPVVQDDVDWPEVAQPGGGL